MNITVRRGQVAFYLGADHGDFWKLSQELFENPDSLNVGWLIDDNFIDKLKANDEETVNRWNRILYVRMAKGKGYLTFTDKMNRNKAETFKRLDLKVKGSNLCVAPETKILTEKGYEVISELENEKVNVWNGKEWSEVVVQKTGENQKLIKVTLVVNSIKGLTETVIRATPYHKWYAYDGNIRTTSELVNGLGLLNWVDPDGNIATSFVKTIEDSENDDTYCVNEPKENKVVFNGILTGNCNELNLPANEKYSSTCVIINANLALYDEFPKHLFHLLHIMQDANVTGYLKQIENTKSHNRQLLQKAYDFTKDFRAVGTSVCGLHSLFMKRRIAVGSIASFQLNDKIFKRMQKDTNEANVWLADVLGVPDGVKSAGLHLRNATTIMLAPTKSSTELARHTPTEGIGLETALIKVKESAGGEIFRVNYEFLEFMKSKGMYNPEEVARIAKNKGSCQDCSWMTDDEKAVFRIAFEVPMDAHIDLCSARQKYIDQQQSINLYFSGSDDEEYIGRIHKKAALDEGINSLYYCYSSRGGRYTRIKECEVCQ